MANGYLSLRSYLQIQDANLCKARARTWRKSRNRKKMMDLVPGSLVWSQSMPGRAEGAGEVDIFGLGEGVCADGGCYNTSIPR